MSPARTAAQRQADLKARRLRDGLVHWKRWVHPDDVPALAECADKLQRKRQKNAAIKEAAAVITAQSKEKP